MRCLLLITALLLVESCQLVEPNEVAATVFNYRYSTMCTCCGGLEVQVGSAKYRTRVIPTPFITDTLPVNKDSLNVWIPYKGDDSECGRIQPTLTLLLAKEQLKSNPC
ncbi:hypothetical protein FHK02_5499 [Spirosoma sp. LMG 31448]|uniref:Uncharacterized protein n=1 Tax=Spirosoma utsteinense TaxID=2585773 RepID=A0ABR6WDM8_9BACT|nr:hypothetical protein [Spirosoma utsteinense]MBC3794655.1 hypothetical protein [Spirosoma utsteinense]